MHKREPLQAFPRWLLWEVLHRDLKCGNLLLDVSGRAAGLQQHILNVTLPDPRYRHVSVRRCPRSKFPTLAVPGSHLTCEDKC